MNTRIGFIFLVGVLVWGGIVARGFFIQVLPNSRLESVKKKQFKTSIKLKPRRGAILDRSGKELAITIPGHSVFLDPKEVHLAGKKKKRQIVKKLSKALGISKSRIRKSLKSKKRRFVWLDRDVAKDKIQKVRKLHLRGVGILDEPKRVYPNTKLLSQAMGFVGAQGEGLEGLELAYDDILRGETKRLRIERDARGRPLLQNGRLILDSTDGADLMLTIDSSLQFQLEAELESVIAEQSAEGAVGIIVQPNTGEILAMASVPTFDLNRPFSVPSKTWRNRAITDIFEPGSTLKTLVIGKALEEGLVQPSTKINCEGGKIKVGGRWIGEADKNHEFDELSVQGVLAHSSNVGMVKIGRKLGVDRLREGLLDFGLGKTSGFELPGESPGILSPLPWRSLKAANIAFGQGVATTPIQIAMAYAAIANGGDLLQPQIVKSINHIGRRINVSSQRKVIRRVMSQSVVETLRLMMTDSAPNARIPGYPIAGKTGTAQKIDDKKGGYQKGVYISSFAGFVPAHDPQYVIYIAVDNPKKEYYGSQVAAPVFARLAQYALRNSGNSPVLISKKSLQKFKTASNNSRAKKQTIKHSAEKVPSLLGLTLREVMGHSQANQIPIKIHGSGRVSSTVPSQGSSLKPNKRLHVYLK